MTPARNPSSNRLWWLAATVASLALVALVYWPVLDAGLVWDDISNFTTYPALYHGDAWLGYLRTGFGE